MKPNLENRNNHTQKKTNNNLPSYILTNHPAKIYNECSTLLPPPFLSLFVNVYLTHKENNWRKKNHALLFILFIGSPPPKDALDSVENVAIFLRWILTDCPDDEFGSQEWDIRDEQHHSRWQT